MRKRIGGAALALAAVAIFAAACGSGDDSPSADAAASGGTDYASCLRNNGVELPQMNASNRPTARPSFSPRPSGEPRPSGSGGFRGGGGPGGGGGFFGTAAPNGVDQQTWEKAQKACESLRPTAFPSGGFGGGGGPGGGGGNGRNAAYINCLTEHGVTVNGPIDQLDTSDPKVSAAITACAPLRPSAQPAPSAS
ncbi:hypothetical protein ACFFX1_30290 [Dactylosporangium sucinum]|uniref:Uncharacterized protein n=1 Tax=Dactylosporangium sucinum TaxID=1424081 RepID=A0A917UD15_9ACTN|nr:hypothetical protein [Dactylosporangium sucinum]GGM83848.1 hypothetical protein GCM10007977_101570 [Dactylosporangium sucinum]